MVSCKVNKMEIRKAKIEDFDEILGLVHQLSPLKEGEGEVDLGVFKKIIHDENHEIYVVDSDKGLIGTGMLLVQLNLSHGGRPSGHIENVVVDEKQRGKGVGKKIVDFLLDRAKERNCYKVILNCKEKNISFYEECGMKNSEETEMRLDVS